jgi:hypothetical protein
MLAMLVAAMIAAAPLDAPHAALLHVLSSDPDAGSCEAAKQRTIAAAALIRKLGRVGGEDVVLAAVEDPCICGAQNCPYFAIRLTPGKPRVLLTAYAIAVRDADHATPLPGLIVGAHDSAMVVDETTYAYRNGSYAEVSSARVRATDRARKPDRIPVRFAAGASSAPLHGSVSIGWYDDYELAASKGQTIVVSGVRSRAKVRLTLFGPAASQYAELRAGVPYALPGGGTYRLHVENDSEDDVPYALTLAIR